MLNEPFKGVEQQRVYRYQAKGLAQDDPGDPVQRKRVHSVMKPPGVPDLITRRRFVAPGDEMLRGMAWSAGIPITRVEVSTDGQETWHDADLHPPVGPWSWTPWSYLWRVESPGDADLVSRATDAEGNVQPLDPNALWSRHGMGSVGVQHMPVTVQNDVGSAGLVVPSAPRLAIPGAKVHPRAHSSA